MVNIYKTEASKDCDAIRIWIPANKIPFIVEQLTPREMTLLARQIVTTHKVAIAYFGDDIPTLLQHLEETYNYTLSQIRDIILWCGKRISRDKCLELLRMART